MRIEDGEWGIEREREREREKNRWSKRKIFFWGGEKKGRGANQYNACVIRKKRHGTFFCHTHIQEIQRYRDTNTKPCIWRLVTIFLCCNVVVASQTKSTNQQQKKKKFFFLQKKSVRKHLRREWIQRERDWDIAGAGFFSCMYRDSIAFFMCVYVCNYFFLGYIERMKKNY